MVPAFLRSSGASAARRRVLLAVWVIPLIVASLRTLLAAPTAARSQLATNDPRPMNPTYHYVRIRMHAHTRQMSIRTHGRVDARDRQMSLSSPCECPLTNSTRRRPPNPVLPAARARSDPKIDNSLSPSPHNLPGTIIQAQNYSEMQNQKSLLLTYAAPVPTTPISVGNPMTDALFQPHSIISSSARQPSMTNSDERR